VTDAPVRVLPGVSSACHQCVCQQVLRTHKTDMYVCCKVFLVHVINVCVRKCSECIWQIHSLLQGVSSACHQCMCRQVLSTHRTDTYVCCKVF